MKPVALFAPVALDPPGVRVRTLVGLRWIAILGQLATLGFVGLYLGYPLPWAPALATVAASILLNLGLSTLYARRARLDGGGSLFHLGFDLVQLSVLLFLTGGLANPFAVLLLVPVTVAATLVSRRETLLLLAAALLLLLALEQLALPLPWAEDEPPMHDIYRVGLFAAIGLGMTFLAVYVGRLSAEARNRASALFATQGALERETKMSALGSLAAAAAHELGGPLGTIALVAHDLEDALGNDPDFGDDIRLLSAEVARSRAILADLARRAEADEPFPQLPLTALLHEIAQPFAAARVPVVVATAPDVEVPRSPELLHGLSNLLDNAVRHALTRVTLSAESDGDLAILIADDGPGFDAALLPHLGEPALGPSRSRAGGTGLGIFIATTLIERTGGRVRFANAEDDGGARVEIRWRNGLIGPTPPAL